MKHRLAVNPITCTGHGICAELLPEMIGLDEWGYPVLADRQVPHELMSLAKRAVRLCPTLALRLESASADRRVPTDAGPARTGAGRAATGTGGAGQAGAGRRGRGQ